VGHCLFPGVILLALSEIFKASPGYRNGIPPLPYKKGNTDGIESNPFFYYLKVKRNDSGKFLLFDMKFKMLVR
jgi:hypothetical protein